MSSLGTSPLHPRKGSYPTLVTCNPLRCRPTRGRCRFDSATWVCLFPPRGLRHFWLLRHSCPRELGVWTSRGKDLPRTRVTCEPSTKGRPSDSWVAADQSFF